MAKLINPPAFPYHGEADGMSLRDYFAAHIMSGLAVAAYTQDGIATSDNIAMYAYSVADAMLKQRLK